MSSNLDKLAKLSGAGVYELATLPLYAVASGDRLNCKMRNREKMVVP